LLSGGPSRAIGCRGRLLEQYLACRAGELLDLSQDLQGVLAVGDHPQPGTLHRSQMRHVHSHRWLAQLSHGGAGGYADQSLCVRQIALAGAGCGQAGLQMQVAQITTDTVDIRRHLEAVRQELRAPLGVLDLAEGHAEAAGDAQLADAVATLTHRFVETLDAYERAVEALDALEAIAR